MKVLSLLFAAAMALGSPRVARADSGAWTNQGLPQGVVRALAVDPADPLTLYTSVGAPFGSPTGVLKSIDGGDTWTWLDGSSVAALIVDPSEPSTVYAGGEGIRKSLDGGLTWSTADAGLSCSWVTALVLDRERPATLLAGTAYLLHTPAQCGALFRSVDTGSTWSEVLARRIAGVAVDPKSSLNIVAIQLGASGDRSLVRTTDGGSNWAFVSSPSSPLFVLPDPVTGNQIYAGSDGLTVSRDGGESWQEAGLSGLVVTALAIDPMNPAILYAGTQPEGVWRSLDGGRSWSAFNTGLTGSSVTALAINATGTRLYAGTDGTGVFVYELAAPRAIVVPRPRPTRALERSP